MIPEVLGEQASKLRGGLVIIVKIRFNCIMM